jgi:hypothetical protein
MATGIRALQTNCKRTTPKSPDLELRGNTGHVRFPLADAVRRTHRHGLARPDSEMMSEDAKFALGF